MSARVIRSLRFIPRHKKKIFVFGFIPGVLYKTYLNSMVKQYQGDMGQFETTNAFKLQQMAEIDQNQESL
jgi:hypothetical protein